jgi:hypothetical protein
LTQSPCCFNSILQQLAEQLERLYAFQEHMKEETEIVFKLKIVFEKNLRVKLEERAMEHRKLKCFFFYSNVTKSVT